MPPDWVLETEIKVIDVDTLELIIVTIGEYEMVSKTDPSTQFKIMSSGRIVTMPVRCKSGGELTIPLIEPVDYDEDDCDDFYWDFLCARCGGYVYREPEDAEYGEFPEKSHLVFLALRR